MTQAALGKEMHTYREEKESFEKKIHDNNREIENVEMLLKYIDLEAIIREDADNINNVQLPYFVKRNASALATWSGFRNKEKKDDFYSFNKWSFQSELFEWAQHIGQGSYLSLVL